jgi:hypothetical protein
MTRSKRGDPRLIHACVNKSSGEVRIVSANAPCKKNETALTWPGIFAVGKGSIMVHAAHLFAPVPPGSSLCISIGNGACGYRSPRVGTIQNVRILIESNSYNAPAVVTLFVNGAPTSITATIPGGSTADINVPGAVGILDGDKVSVLLAGSAGLTGGAIDLSVSYEIK